VIAPVIHDFLLTAAAFARNFAEVALVGFVLAGVINAVVNKPALARHLGGSVLRANAVASTWGFLTPLCCCSGVPTAVTLYRSGSRRGPACAFLIAVPWFNWYGLTALMIFLGWRAGLAVSLSAVGVAFITGAVIDTLDARWPSPHRTHARHAQHAAHEGGSAHHCGAPSDPAPEPDAPLLDLSNPWEKARAGLQFASHLALEIAPWIVAGILLGAAAETFIPSGFLSGSLGKTSLMGLLIAVVVASVSYTESMASLPWVRALLNKGAGIGSGMVLLVGGVATNLSTLGPIARVMGARTAIVYATSVVLLATALGYWLNHIL